MNAIIKLILELIGLSKKASKKKKTKAAKPQKQTFSPVNTGKIQTPSACTSAGTTASQAKPAGQTSAQPIQPSKPSPVQAVLCETCASAIDPKIWFCQTCGSRTSLAEPVFSSASEDQKKVSNFKYSQQHSEKKAKEYAALNIQKEGDFLYKVNGNSILITGFIKLNVGVQIPSQIQGLPVTEIGEKAFREKGITSVTIPSSVTSIGEWAFSKNALTAITIPGNVASVGKFAFANNAFTSIVLEEGVKSVGESAFEKQTKFSETVSTVANIVIPGSMKKIEDNAFARSRIGSVTFSSGVKTIGDNAFLGNQFKSVVFPEGVTEIGKNAFDENFIESVAFPDSLTKIGERAFTDAKLTSVTLPVNLKTIGNRAFYSNKLTEISVPGSVKKIGNEAFAKNELTRINLGEGVESIGKNAFSYNKFEKVQDISLPSTITIIDDEAFTNNKITGDLTIPESVSKIGDSVFYSNKLTGVMIRGKTEIGAYAFGANEIRKVIIGGKVPAAGNNSFDGNKIIGVTVPDGVKVTGFDTGFGKTAPFKSNVYLYRGDTDNLSFDDSAYWDNFEQKIKADIESKVKKLPVICYDAIGNKIGSIDKNPQRAGFVIFDEKHREAIARIFLMSTSYYQNLGIPFGQFSTDHGDIVQHNGGMVTADGIVLRDFSYKFVEEYKGVIKSSGKDEAEKLRIGKIEVQGETGIAYDKNGVKVGEVRNSGQDALVFAAAMLRFIICK